MRVDKPAPLLAWYMTVSPLATLPWLIRIRWITACAAAAAVGGSLVFDAVDFPLRTLWPLLAASAVGNALVARSLGRGNAARVPLTIFALAADMLLLTGLLELTGGPFNPFIVVFAAQVALAALTVGRGSAMLLAALAAGSLAALTYWHIQELDAGHHRLTDFPTHLLTLWLALAAVADLAGYFIVQTSNALARRERELESMRQQAARTERVVSLTTLAAGAAHELSTPLATIALTARELEHALAARAPSTDLVQDAQLIRSEVDRCRQILDHMSGRAGGATADDPETIDAAALLREIRMRLPAAARVQLRLPDAPVPVRLPRAGLTQAVQSLVANALDATADQPSDVIVGAVVANGRLTLSVSDQGARIPADVLQRAGEPFFTTKEPGRGLGLGLFLARVFAERCGGTLTLQSDQGTLAQLDLPSSMPPR